MTLKISSKNEFIQIKKVKPPKKKETIQYERKKIFDKPKTTRFY
mgnify:FL=1|jgi:hypothetical protein